MKALLIPPIPELEYFGSGSMHLILSHLLSNDAYFDHYKKQAELGSYLILDNSAHEHRVGDDPLRLLRLAEMIGAQELVCPDVLFDNVQTVVRTTEALSYFCTDGYDQFLRLNPRLMLVPQGSSYVEFRRCLRTLLAAYQNFQQEYPHIFKQKPVVGLSKDYEKFVGGLHQIIENDLYPSVEDGLIDVHCLGWGRNLWKISEIAADFPKIRSIDSAKPFVFAMAGVKLVWGQNVQYPTRPLDYFVSSMTNPIEFKTALSNVDTFKSAAGDR